MAAYAALVSLKHTIKQIQDHPFPPISLDQHQAQSLTEKLNFLQKFLEDYNGGEAEILESRIADLAHAAEDVIESHVVDQILDAAASTARGEEIRSDLERVIEDMDLIERDVIKIKEKMTRVKRNPSVHHSAGSSRPAVTRQRNRIVGLDAVTRELMDKLIGGESDRRIIPIVGMSGIGKTTLARSVYKNKVTARHFVIRAWVTISQEYRMVDILSKLLNEDGDEYESEDLSEGGNEDLSGGEGVSKERSGSEDLSEGGNEDLSGGEGVSEGGNEDMSGGEGVSEDRSGSEDRSEGVSENRSGSEGMSEGDGEGEGGESGGGSSQMDEDKLGDELHKKLFGRRYLIILDDIWNVEVWDKLKFYFPENSNESRIILTTRLSKLASHVAHCGGIQMQFLDKNHSWGLFCKIVFDREGCPVELEKIGRKIVKSCKGLPLSISVIGGLLAKSTQTRRSWKYIGKNLNSIVNLEDNEHCLQVLYLSYYNLPVYLKPCFLYMGVFPEDFEIDVSKLMKVWIAEGFLKPIDGKLWEEIAQEFLDELIDRNLILVEKCNFMGKVKSCKVHDLLKDLCVREARKQKFFSVFGVQSPNIPQDLNTITERRLSILSSSHMVKWPQQLLDAMESSSLARSLIWEYMQPELPAPSFRLLRVRFPVVDFSNKHHLKVIFQKVNLRYVDAGSDYYIPAFPRTFYRLWNLQTLIFSQNKICSVPSDIWEMPQLRHVKIWAPLMLPDPAMDGIVLENLQKLAFINKFKCSEEITKRIPNIKELSIAYWGVKKGSSCYHLNNLDRLHNLETLWLALQRPEGPDYSHSPLMEDIVFPHSLKKLTLEWTQLDWEDITEKIGSLPCLQVLKLQNEAVVGPEWNTSEGQFPKLKLLEIDGTDLEDWTSENSHFPCLEHLVLGFMKYLVEIPSSMGDIYTLKSILVEETCSESAIASAKSIEMEQEELGNEGLRVRIFPLHRRWKRGNMRMLY